MASAPNDFAFNSDSVYCVFLKFSGTKQQFNISEIQIVAVKFLPTLLNINHIKDTVLASAGGYK